MAKDPENSAPASRTGALSRSVKARRSHHGRLLRSRLSIRLMDSLAQPTLGLGLLVALLFAAACSGLVIWTRGQPLVAVGRVMDDTRLVRVQMRVSDDAATTQAREQARQSTPRVFRSDAPVLDALAASLESLPQVAAGAETLEALDPTIRQEYGLTPDIFAALKLQAVDARPTSAWVSKVRTLHALLRRRPILESQTWQRAVQEGTAPVVRLLDAERELISKADLINLGDKDRLVRAVEDVARGAGLTGPLQTLVTNRLSLAGRPTFTFDEAATVKDQNDAAFAVVPVERTSAPGQIIFQRGVMLTPAQAELFRAEQRYYREEGRGFYPLARSASVIAACLAVTLALGGYTVLFIPRVRKNASRMAGIAATLLLALGIACVGGVQAPEFNAAFAITPTLFVAMLLTIAYDRRAALAYGMLHAVLVCIALRESVGTMAVVMTGIGCVVWTLKEIRDRNTLLRTSIVTAVGVALATVVFSFIERPFIPDVRMKVLREVFTDAGLAGGGALLIGGITLFVLPLIERAFNVTTGMTLIDLRDPKQPLLKELQFRAPGTYNHSLNVASIAEAAAEAIGGDSLYAYVGALYHDVGKMNKPEYFVENQQGGPNKHDKLSPAMSLLVVVGHVKDGMELAREFKIPHRLHHFIESHHGTTLVEFFYHRARKQALAKSKDAGEADSTDSFVPDEFEYRYPGPKPRTKEAAILMLADSTESAARAMPEPTPSRIDALARGIANKRLLDGQFDDCELTLKELHVIVASISRTVTSMYHGRIVYPEGEVDTPTAMEQRA